MNRERACEDFLKLYNEVAGMSERLIYHQEISQLYMFTLLANILEKANGVYILIKEGNYTSTPIVLRSMLEAYVDLRSAKNDSNYIKHALAAYAWERIEAAKIIQNSNDESAKLDIELANKYQIESQEEQKQLSQEGFSRLFSKEKFEKANCEANFKIVNMLLCSYSHNNISRLEQRHLEVEGDKAAIVVFKDIDDSDLKFFFSLLITILFGAIEVVLISLDQMEEHKSLFKHMLSFREIHGIE
ncbi:DUF5677 domain-containing protein [Desulfocurvibacter africanus]|uniref:DUF5677 domain-containing protein n=1 Tax=Desulfocurvibacter africanus TaxID=873 RepID=UPI0004885D1A|nr:DUF5677 domain-containing protein [Desulfocurvibacter africanus]